MASNKDNYESAVLVKSSANTEANNDRGDKSDTLEMLDALTNKIFSKQDIETKTDINIKQVLAFSRARAYADEFEVPIIDKILDHYAIYAISKDRKSRKEYSKALQALTSYAVDSEREPRSIPDNLLGRG